MRTLPRGVVWFAIESEAGTIRTKSSGDKIYIKKLAVGGRRMFSPIAPCLFMFQRHSTKDLPPATESEQKHESDTK